MGGLPVGPGRVNRLKCPDSWVWVVRPPSLGGSIIVSHSKAWATAVHPLLTAKQDLTPVNPAASGILAVSLPIFFWRSPDVFPTSFSIPSVNLLANFGEIPLHHPNSGPMLKLDLGPSYG
ncbi:hypothetical protein BHM03_00062457 [Ensete ventricosum]|nr:hypothetical protein BHM03_00062457 [Ensete ventricosum]